MRESTLLEHIRRRSADLASTHPDIVVGPGDDCAVVRSGSGELLLIGVDQLIIGRHVTPDTPAHLIARKAVARSISDIAAMGGTPSWALATAALPPAYQNADALFDAMSRWARHWSCPLIGGDIATTTGPLVLTVTVAGHLDGGAPVLRSGARPGDVVLVTGPIGASFQSGWHLAFEPRIAAGTAARVCGAHAMIDISDGLGRDAARVGHASGVRLQIHASRVPRRAPDQPWHDACSDGEDYELLICGPPDLASGPAAGLDAHRAALGPLQHATAIGTVRPCRDGEPPGATLIDDHGREHDGAEMGWDHAH